jgi:antitoxin (DNA-binding transcriptional repressor) of toxin-antitoxin stability system
MDQLEVDVEDLKDHLVDYVNHALHQGGITHITSGGRRIAAIAPTWIAEQVTSMSAAPTHRAVLEASRENDGFTIFIYRIITDEDTGEPLTGDAVAMDHPSPGLGMAELTAYTEQRLPELGYRVVSHGGVIFDLLEI